MAPTVKRWISTISGPVPIWVCSFPHTAYRSYREQGFTPEEIYHACLSLYAKGIDVNAGAPGDRNWKTPDEQDEEAARKDQYIKISETIYDKLAQMDTLAHGGQAKQALRELSALVRTKSKPINQERLEAVMEEIGLSVRLNLITKKFEYVGWATVWRDLEPGRLDNDIPVKLVDMTQETLSKVDDGRIRRLIGVIAGEHSYNPVLDLIQAETVTQEAYEAEWGKLVKSMNVKTSFEESLLYKWFLQGIALLHNAGTKGADYSADGMLVLYGDQGCGKTSFVVCAGLDPEWYMTGSKIKQKDKDYLIRSTGRFITEFGEGERSFLKNDPEDIKAFITQGTDFYRRPYDRADTEAPRHTNFVATCNSKEFLVDLTGNRRFWIVDVNGMDVDAMRKVDFLTIWRGMFAIWHDLKKVGMAHEYRLTAKERETLEERNKPFMRPVKAQDECADIFAMVDENPDMYVWEDMTVTDFMSEWNDMVFGKRHFNSAVVGRALKAMGFEAKSKKRNGRTAQYIRLPRKT